ncbi:type VI secretion system-associated FHA domain protein TagH [Rheinheimera fenheensis]|uniref:type VI secretion system-associated FHA domain protein TagH n=1 Tax=Rheinheimera fenheensis TaxID=3152295 RepID=UPI003260B939
MLLELSVLSYHRLSPRQVAVKRFDSQGGSLGRSEQADWYLPDPERVVSGVHAIISYQQGQFRITDQSTNGLFVNRSVEPLGQGNSHSLHHGDILCLGDYEIQVALIDSVSAEKSAEHSLIAENTQKPPLNRHSDVATGLTIGQAAAASITPAFEPQPLFNAPNTMRSDGASASQASVANTMAFDAQSNLALDNLDQHFHAPSALIPDDWESPWQEEPATPLGPVKQPLSAPSGKSQPGNSSDSACVQAFIRGLGLSEANQAAMQNEQCWLQLGQALQQALQGVIAVMHERSQVKSSFRVNQTTFQQRENNPLKFSANLDDAFHNLFNRPGSSFMPARQAIAEAFSDISRHEAAIIAGARGAMSGLMAELAPQRLEAADFGSNLFDKLNPAQRQARLWARYKALHQELAGEVNDKNKQGVNDDFISAYEAYLRQG